MKKIIEPRFFRLACLLVFLGGSIALPVFAAESGERTLASVAATLTNGVGLFIRIMWAACVLIGIGLLLTAFTQYQIHRHNPKLVPLPVPITYFLLALLTLAIPFSHTLFGLSKEDPYKKQQRYEIIKKNYQQYILEDIDKR